ncbi:hypothetical protein D3C79_831390 [compost metagenome]
MLTAKITQPRQQDVAAKVRGRRHLQHPTQGAVRAVQVIAALAQALQHAERGGQVQLTLGCQAQAAGGTCEQAHVQVALQAFDGGCDLPGQQR